MFARGAGDEGRDERPMRGVNFDRARSKAPLLSRPSRSLSLVNVLITGASDFVDEGSGESLDAMGEFEPDEFDESSVILAVGTKKHLDGQIPLAEG